ncbi:hypothetical protein B0H21DRAFT_718709 [Amylocystis lapponica]|nr:hypothetical protein B0H21DRAFT_718709 [Amylocystis lapponica]
MSDSPTKVALASRKGKEREPAQPTDIAERVIAFQRRHAVSSRPREKTERPPQNSSSSTPRNPPPHPPSPRRTHAPPMPSPNIIISATSPRISHSKSQNPAPSQAARRKAVQPKHGPVRKPVMTAEPDTPRGAPPHGPRSHHQSQQMRAAGDQHRQLFDHRKDDPVRFSVLTRPHASPNTIHASPTASRPTPTPKSSGDYVSASSTSSASYAQSTISSNFTLSSNTTTSSDASALFDTNGRRSEDSANGTNAFSMQLKNYINKILNEDKDKERDDDGDRDGQKPGVLVMGRGAAGLVAKDAKSGDDEAEKWKRLITDHKDLAEKMHNLLTLTLAPSVPASLRNIPSKYNLIIRLWTHAFYRLLESLRRAARPPATSPIALEHLQDFIYYAYTFYTGLLEERNLAPYRAGWVEALGDLARYRMIVSAMVEGTFSTSGNLTAASLASNTLDVPRPATPNASAISDNEVPMSKAVSPTPAARIDDSPEPSNAGVLQQNVPSVGVAAARMMEMEPEKERWRQIARDWYARGLAGTPGAGKLHHHLGLLSRDKDGGEEELRGVYHFVKSMITLHPFTTSRESILQLWSSAAQARRQAPDARLTELFVLLHGMLFTNIQLDDFSRVLARFEEKLQIDGGGVAEEREWIMMAIVNLGALLEYGKPTAELRRVAAIGGRENGSGSSPAVGNGAGGRVKLLAKRAEEEKKMDVDEDDEGVEAANGDAVPMATSPTLSTTPSAAASGSEISAALTLGMQLAFSMLETTLQKPTRKSSRFARSTLNPYITILLTFLATVLKDRHALAVFERAIPWTDIAAFLNTAPRRLMLQEQLIERTEGSMLLTSGCAPLPEDWCLRGLGWGGKKVYERGFWGKDGTAGEERNVELEVLNRAEDGDEQADGIIEDEDEGTSKERLQTAQNDAVKRWVRVARAGLKLARYVDGFDYVPAATADGRGQWKVDGVLAAKVARWKEEERREREEEERRLHGTRWDDEMDVDDEDGLAMAETSDDSEEDEQDSVEVKELKARRRYLQSLLQSDQRGGLSSTGSRRRPRSSTVRKPLPSRQPLRVLPGYSILVLDTNILLSSLTIVSTLVESIRWTIVIPLPVIMELDGLATNKSPLGEAASAALDYITSHIRSHSTSLKVQTSRGNYLASLTVRTEQVEFARDEASWERNMDDLILRAAIWQEEHWVDRSDLLKSEGPVRDTAGAPKVVLLSFDRMLRLKARSRQLCAPNEQDLASILAPGS